jgi:hypothetical protein
MTRARDIADSGIVINVLDGITTTATELNYLDGVTSNIQTQLASVDVDRFSANTISTNTTIDADTYYKTGKSLIINNGITFTIPVNSLLEIEVYTTGKAL